MQKLSLSIFFSGLSAFLMSVGEFFTRHNSWSDLTTVHAVGHIIIMTASFCMTLTGALGVHLPRDVRTEDRVSDRKLISLNGADEKETER